MTRPRKRRWGSGEVHQTSSGWQIRWRENGLRRTRGGFATREDAERVLAKIRGDMAQGRAGLPRDPRGLPTLGELAPAILERRKLTHRAADCDFYRWRKHLEPHFGALKPNAVDVARIRAFVELKLAEKLNPATIRIFVALLSAVFVDLAERGLATGNPARGLPASLRRLIRPTHDPKKTPFIERLEDVRRIFLALSEPLNIAYAIGALGGLRTGEVFALRWLHVDIAARRIHVRESIKGPLKDGDSRIVPILDALAPILTEWKLRTGGAGRVIPPLRCDGKKIDKATPGKFLGRALKQLGLTQPDLGWYEATRHTFASQWVLAGNSIEKLSAMLGHYSVVMTERYAHLRPELFSQADLATIKVDLRAGSPDVAQLGHEMATAAPEAAANDSKRGQNGRSRPVSRVLSPRSLTVPGEADIPLGPALPQGSSELPGSAAGRRCRAKRLLPYLPLHRVGLAVPPVSPRARCALTAPFHPCLRLSPPAVCSLWRCPASRLGWTLSSTLPCGARTFLPRVDLARAGVRPDGSDRDGV